MAVRRRFSTAFKRQVAEELLAGAATMAQLCRRYELCQTVVRSWKQQYAQGRLAEAEGVGQDQAQRLQELERMVGLLPPLLLFAVAALPLLPAPRWIAPVEANAVLILGPVLPLVLVMYLAIEVAVGIGSFWHPRQERPRRLALSLVLLCGLAAAIVSIRPAVSLRWWLVRQFPDRAQDISSSE